MTYQYSFKDCLERAERINWRVEDLIGEGKTLDFTKPFMPESLARTEALSFLSPGDQLALNQIRGHAYLAIFGLVEEFILPFIVDHARPLLHGDDYRSRAFLEFAAEEAKHIQLFRRFREEFTAGFGSTCDVIGPPEAVREHVFSHPPLSVALLTLHIEWMTQRHFLNSVEGDGRLDPQFKNLLLHHWMEEHQHAQLDAILVDLLAESLSKDEIEAGIEGYLALGGYLDAALKAQTAFDLEALERATGRVLSEGQREVFLELQHQANRWTYIGSGMGHAKFLESIGRLSPMRRTQIEALVEVFC